MTGIVTPTVPFSNGTEEIEWMSKWCNFCAIDHPMHPGGSQDGTEGCSIILDYMLGVSAAHRPDGEPYRWPEAWMPEPDDGRHFLPSRMVCLAFKPCTAGHCNGDPGADERAERVATVVDYWRTRAGGDA